LLAVKPFLDKADARIPSWAAERFPDITTSISIDVLGMPW